MATWLGPPVEKYDYGTNGGSWTRQPAMVALHSTEGTGWTSYNGGSVAPHFTIQPKTGEIHQHISLGVAARALAHPSGTPETNRAGVIQVEIIGTCDPSHRGDSGWNYLPDMDATQAGHIRALLDLIHAAVPAIPLTTSVEFAPYPEPSYGDGHPRLSQSAFSSYKGVLGHMHVPSNSHGDPGNIPIATILGPGSQEDYEMMGIVKTSDKAAQFIYTGTGLVWLQDADHRDRMKGEYRKQTGKDLILTTIGADGSPIERGLYGWLSDAQPDPTSAGVESGWDFSEHRVNLDHPPGSDVSADPAIQQARVDFHRWPRDDEDDG